MDNRTRLNSKDIPRTYSGLYGQGGPIDPSSGDVPDLLPFELTRNRNADWLDTGTSFLLVTYLGAIAAFQLAAMAAVPYVPFMSGVVDRVGIGASWTLTNVTHGVITYVYLHWIKGSPNFYEQGEMNAMTTWEQIESSPNRARENQKRVIIIVPALLCHAACQFAMYDKGMCLINVIVWVVVTLGKMGFMCGVRILGINRTPGIDDDNRKRR